MSTPSHPENEGNKPKGDPNTYSQEFQVANIGARVPEKVARGVFSTGVLVLQGGSEFVLDFLLRMNQPHQVVSRVVLPMNLVPQFIDVLRTNLENYRKTFGTTPPPMPQAPPPAKPPTIDEIYQAAQDRRGRNGRRLRQRRSRRAHSVGVLPGIHRPLLPEVGHHGPRVPGRPANSSAPQHHDPVVAEFSEQAGAAAEAAAVEHSSMAKCMNISADLVRDVRDEE